MRRAILTKIWIILFSAMMLSAAAAASRPVVVRAAQAELVTLDREQDIAVILSYDVQEPQISVISPNGKVYSSDEMYAQVDRASGVVYYYIADAGSGTWMIDYEKGANTELDVKVVPWHQSIQISSLTFEETGDAGNQELKILYSAQYAKYGGSSFRADFSAVQTDEEGSVLRSFPIGDLNCYSGENREASLSLREVPDGTYCLQMTGWADDNGTEVTGTFVTNATFTVSGNTSQGEAQYMKLLCDVSSGILSVDFGGEENNVENISLSVLQGDTQLYAETYEEQSFEDSVLFEASGEKLTVSILARTRADGYISWTREVETEMPCGIRILSPEYSNSTVGIVEYDTGSEKIQARLSVGDKVRNLELSGSGRIQTDLESMTVNELTVQIERNDVTYQISQRISADTTAPVIDLYGTQGKIRTNEKTILLVGSTDPGVSLTCGGEKIEIDENGAFSYEAELREGENILEFRAENEAGNVTLRSVDIIRGESTADSLGGDEKKGFPTALLLTFILSAIVMLITAVAGFLAGNRADRNGEPHKNRAVMLTSVTAFLITLALLCIGGAALMMVLRAQYRQELKGERLVTLVQGLSTGEMADMIRMQDTYFHRAIVLAAAAVVLTAAAVLIIVLRHRRKTLISDIETQEEIYDETYSETYDDAYEETHGEIYDETDDEYITSDSGEAAPAGGYYCPRCGRRIESDKAAFCPYCGERIGRN